MKKYLILCILLMLNLPTVHAARKNAPQWDGFWASGGITAGTKEFSLNYGAYLSASDSSDVAALDMKVGRAFRRWGAYYLRGTLGGFSSGSIGMMLRPTNLPFFVSGELGTHESQVFISGGGGIDIFSRISLQLRGLAGGGVEANTEFSAFLVSINYIWGRQVRSF